MKSFFDIEKKEKKKLAILLDNGTTVTIIHQIGISLRAIQRNIEEEEEEEKKKSIQCVRLFEFCLGFSVLYISSIRSVQINFST